VKHYPSTPNGTPAVKKNRLDETPRYLRPEAFGGRVHQHRIGQTNYPIHESLFESEAVI